MRQENKTRQKMRHKRLAVRRNQTEKKTWDNARCEEKGINEKEKKTRQNNQMRRNIIGSKDIRQDVRRRG